MRTVSLATAMFASMLFSSSVIAKTDQLAGSTNAGHDRGSDRSGSAASRGLLCEFASERCRATEAFDVRRETGEAGRGARQEIEHLPLLISTDRDWLGSTNAPSHAGPLRFTPTLTPK
ncbi:hypothetical protein V1282_006696 [Nitrobacteraceae bacterium AZCC 2146]